MFCKACKQGIHSICTLFTVSEIHDDVIKWKHFPRYWPCAREIHRSPVNSLHKDQWRGVFMFSLICAWINIWVNNHETGDSRRYRAHYDVIVMSPFFFLASQRYICASTVGCFNDISVDLGILHKMQHEMANNICEKYVDIKPAFYRPSCHQVYISIHVLPGMQNYCFTSIDLRKKSGWYCVHFDICRMSVKHL